MPAPSPASCRCAERGAAVVTALLTVALVAGLASALVADYGAGLESLAGRRDQAQARWLARGAVDWGRNVLADDRRRTRVDHLGETWAIRVPPMAVEEGEVGGELQDLSGLFNVNNLAPAGEASEANAEAFVRLASATGISAVEAAAKLISIISEMREQRARAPRGRGADARRGAAAGAGRARGACASGDARADAARAHHRHRGDGP